jgi:hypothetical protein
VAISINITWLDSYGRTTTKRYESDRAALADCLTDAAALIAAMGDISDAGVTKFEVVDMVPNAVSATALSNVDVGATLHVTLNNGKGYALHVPMIKAEKVGAGGAIDVSDEDIVAFTDLFLTGGHFRMSEGNFLVTVNSGELDK